MKKKRFFELYGGYIFVAPWLLGFILLTLIPFICLLYFSFTDYNMFTSPVFAGLKNYIEIVTQDEKFIISLTVTFIYALISVPLKLIAALLVAVLLKQKRRGIGIYRTLFYIPSIIGGSVAVSVMWRNLFSRDGAVNALIEALTGINADISWVADPNTALGSLILMSIWQFGSPMLIFLAGLKNISTSYYEAAKVDGANSIQCFFKITLPLLSPIIFFNLVMQMINGFMTFTQGLVVTNGGPMNRTLFYQLYVYQQGFEDFNMGYASALSCIMFVIVLILTLFVFKSSDAWVYYESGGKK
ncbi:ABC transporter permease [Lachnoclostridium sp. An169]|uniref:carbohydrate ABC transporter permease n=1 Tax=Lachnoclostridium sp. An169 TaxID=1965569 RepID=UPI000B3A9907|nr:sugar ABC transporter permease [Lachnoclostridium sp. An169]OUP86128.1 ABC transporter permease [Lachnoclostridium sp. An169]HJA68238.1 sugar ABC transporter permease [Candidatus Mediterraneibacter cottocaccae]